MEQQFSIFIGVLCAFITIAGAILVGLIHWIVRSSEDRIQKYVQAEVGAVKVQLGEVKERLGAVEAEVGGLKAEVGEVKERLGAVEAEVGGLKAEVGEVKERLGAVEAEVGGLKAEVGEVKERLGAAEADIGGLKAEVGGLKAEVGGLKAEVGGLKADVGALKEQVQTSDERINQRIDRLEASNREEHRILTAEVQKLNVDIAKVNALAERDVARSVADLFARASHEAEAARGDASRSGRIFAETPPEGEDEQR